MQNSTAVPRAPLLRVAIAFDLAIAIAMRLLVLLRYRIDSDEPQHLHVAWEWSQGFLPYRDFYDNHMPLFHVAFVPLVRLAGESSRIFIASRLAMVPIAIATVAIAYAIARRFANANEALLAAVIASLFPPFLLKGTEFRSDNLWALLVVAAVAIATGAIDDRRAIAAGLTTGLALAVSIKTVHAMIALAIAMMIVYGVRNSVRPLLVGLAGIAVVPAAVALWFASREALNDLWRWGVLINGQVEVATWRRVAGMALFALLLFAAFRLARNRRNGHALLAAFTLVYVGSVFAFSPLISPRDFLPVYPLAIVLGARRLGRSAALAMAIPALFALTAFVRGNLLDNKANYWQRATSQALRITLPGDPLLDLKGETIFRHRPTFVAYERVGREMVDRGIVPDRSIEDVVRNRCHVTTSKTSKFPPATRAFLEKHFLQIEDLRVAAEPVADDGSFTIVIPGSYSVVHADGNSSAPFEYAAGLYRVSEFRPGSLVVWDRAVEALTRRDRKRAAPSK